ncbi:MAG: hypothetical protein BroJett021_29960 [Chloroflexota bacterium]|jgi:hypothetical protein|nr:MAG: hypothetical protein BroJett021_29960 [Chloroflexota bacterium]
MSSNLYVPFALPARILGRVVRETRISLEEARWRWQERISRFWCYLKPDGVSSRMQILSPKGLDFQFFHHRTDQSLIYALLAQVNPSAAETIIAESDFYRSHIWGLLGSGNMYLGQVIDWHADIISGYRWDQRRYHKRFYPAPFPGGHDIKFPWELSRCQHLVRLGQAYWITDNEKYALEFVAQVQDWIDCNPWPWGVNWASTMDVAIRAVNWLWGYQFFKESKSLPEQFICKFKRSLLTHGRHIYHNLENRSGITGNHYLSNLVGLIYLGILCPEFKEAGKWREFALNEIETEMFKQVYPDGVDFEASTSYHRLVLEMFLSATLLARYNDHDFSPEYMKRLEMMVEFIMVIIRPDGTAPLIGDSDNGRLHRLKAWHEPEREWNDFRYLLAIGGYLFDREDFLCAAGAELEEAIWLMPERVTPIQQPHERRPLASQRFEHSGFYVLRTDEVHLLVERGEIGLGGVGAHNHYNPLGFELWMNGYAIVVDPGTYVYTADWSAREQYRSMARHNTLCIELPGFAPSYPPQNLFSFQRLYTVREIAWNTNRQFDQLVLERVSIKNNVTVIHRRIIIHWKNPAIVVLRDIVSGTAAVPCFFSLHFSSALTVGTLSATGVNGLALTWSGNDICNCTVLSSSWSMTVVDDWVSPSYGVQHPAKTAKFVNTRQDFSEPLDIFFSAPHITLRHDDGVWQEIQILLSESTRL